MDTPGFTYLVIAYGGFFVVLAAFVVRLQRRTRELERELTALRSGSDSNRAKSS